MTTTGASPRALLQAQTEKLLRLLAGSQDSEQFGQQSSYAKAALKQLREADPTRPERIQASWAIILQDISPELYSLINRSEQPSWVEEALLAAMHLYAVHAQSAKRAVHVRSNPKEGQYHGLGSAVRQLITANSSSSGENSTMRRFNAVLTASSYGERVYHLRQLVSQFRSYEIPLDYVKLADDLYRLQASYGTEQVLLRWAREVSFRPQAAEA